MKHSYYKLIFLIVAVFFISCETTKILYDSKTNPELNRLGVAKITTRIPKIDSLLPKLDSNFKASALRYGNRFLAKETIPLDEKLSCQQPDSLKIIELCAKNNLDGIVLTLVQFRLYVTTLLYIPTDKRIECVLYTKIYDKNGSMLYSAVHDSKEDSYNKQPNAYEVVHLATGITYKRISTERQKK